VRTLRCQDSAEGAAQAGAGEPGAAYLIGYAYVVADIFHIGHLVHLKNCKTMCDVLIVGVLTDDATMEKKPRPIIPLEERMPIIFALECVDVTVVQETYSPKENVCAIKPDILFECACHENPYSNPYGKTMVMPYYPNQTSTKIKQKIIEEWNAKKPPVISK